MNSHHWLFGLLIGLIAIHALFAYHAYRLRTRGATASPGRGDRSTELVDTLDGTVECPDCGSTNELGYRYCRICVSELPRPMRFERDGFGPVGRFAN